MPTKTMKRDEIGPLMKALKDEFMRQLEQLGPKAFSKKTREDLGAGFSDGSRSMLLALENDGYLAVDRSDAPGAATPTAEPAPAPAAPSGPLRVFNKAGHELKTGDGLVDFRGGMARLIGPSSRRGKVLVQVSGEGSHREFNANVYDLEVR